MVYTFSAQLNAVSLEMHARLQQFCYANVEEVFYCELEWAVNNYSQATTFSSHTSYLSGRVQEAWKEQTQKKQKEKSEKKQSKLSWRLKWVHTVITCKICAMLSAFQWPYSWFLNIFAHWLRFAEHTRQHSFFYV